MMTTINNNCQTVSKTKQILEVLNYFLWTDLPRLLTAALWKLYTSRKIKYPTRNDCIAVVTSGEKNSEVFLIKELAKTGFDVVVGANKSENCERLQELIKNKRYPGKIVLVDLDLSSLRSVKEFVEEIDKKYPEVCLLVNNFNKLIDDDGTTEDGFENNMAVNYLGHFYLTHLLLKNLKFTGENRDFFSRVINITSPEFYGATINFNELNNRDHYNPRSAYGEAKLATLMMTKYLNSQMDHHHYPIKIHAVNSGLLDSTKMNPATKNPLLRWILSHLQIKPSESAQSILYACFSKDLEMYGGYYLSNCIKSYTPMYSRNKSYQERLFKVTCELLSLKIFGTDSAALTEKSFHE